MKLFSASISYLMAIAAFTPLASGQTLYWAGGTGASASVGSSPATTDLNFNTTNNWSTVPPNLLGTTGPQSVPTVGNIAVVQADLNNGTILDDFITQAKATPVVINQTLQANTVSGLIVTNEFSFDAGGIVNINNSFNAPLTVAGTNAPGGDFVVDGGDTLNTTGSLALSNGSIVVGDNTYNTNNTAGTGTFNIKTGSLTFDAAGTTTQMYVGYAETGGTANGTVNESGSSVVTTGSSLYLGFNGGTGNWNLNESSTLQTGTLASSYLIALGSNGTAAFLTANGTGSSGTLTISGASVFQFGRAGSNTPTDLQLGTTTAGSLSGTGGSGTIVQNGGTVNIFGQATTVEIGDLGGGTGVYQLKGGTMNIGTNASDAVTFTLGSSLNSTGTFTQSGGILNVGPSSGVNATNFTDGSGQATLNFNGGTANFNTAINFTNASSVINLNTGGTLIISTDNFANSGGQVAKLNYGGGTLKFLAGTTGTVTDVFGGGVLATNTTSTIDATALSSFTIRQTLTGAGNIVFLGSAGTVVNIKPTNLNVNSYTGSTTIAGGTLNVGGADIQNSSALNIDSYNGSTATLNLKLATGLAFGGSINGPGKLTVTYSNAGDTLAIKNSGNFSGQIVLAPTGPKGNLQLFGGTYGDISEVTPGNTVTIGGALPGGIAGGFTVPTSGTVTFGTTTYTGLTTINQNFTLNANNLDGAVTNNGTLNVVNNIGLLATDNVINTGMLTAGSLSGNVTSNTGTITIGSIAGNVTSNAGTITASNVVGNVNNSGTFIAGSPINSTTVGGNVVSSGTLASISALVPSAGAPNATFTVGGNLTQSGTLDIRVNGSTADYFQVNGNATVSGTVLAAGSTSAGAHTFTILDANGGLTTGGLSLGTATALFSITSIQQVGNTLVITTNQNPLSIYALTPNEKIIAQGIDASGGSSVKTIANSITAASATTFFPVFLEQLSPQSYQYSRTIAFENSTFLAQRVDGFCSDLRTGYGGLDTNAVSVVNPIFNNGMGRSLQSFFASDSSFHPSAPNGVNYYPGGSSGGEIISGDNIPAESYAPSSSSFAPSTPTFDSSTQVISDSPNPYMSNIKPEGPETPGFSEFLAGDVILADLNQDQSATNAPTTKASYTTGDVTGGVSFRMNSHLAAGVLFDYNHTDAKTDGYGSKTQVDSYSPGIFATYFDRGLYVNGLFSFGYNDYSNTRGLPSIGRTASSSPSGQQYVTNIDAGYDFHPAKEWVVGPSLGLIYTHLDIDSFTETGASDANLTVDSQSVDSLRTRLGGHVIYQAHMSDVLLQPNLSIQWQHEFLDDNLGITSSAAAFGNPVTIQALTPGRDSALISCGLTATLSNSMALYLNYLADVGASDYFAQSVVGGLKTRF